MTVATTNSRTSNACESDAMAGLADDWAENRQTCMRCLEVAPVTCIGTPGILSDLHVPADSRIVTLVAAGCLTEQ
jgi:hypothetical protein